MINLKDMLAHASKYLNRIMIEIEPSSVIELCERAIAAEELAEARRRGAEAVMNEFIDTCKEIGALKNKIAEFEKQESGTFRASIHGSAIICHDEPSKGLVVGKLVLPEFRFKDAGKPVYVERVLPADTVSELDRITLTNPRLLVKATEAQQGTGMFPQPIFLQIKENWSDVSVPETADTVAAEQPNDKCPVWDLSKSAWEGIQQAAKESKWIPPEYYANDWHDDVKKFLREGIEAFNPQPKLTVWYGSMPESNGKANWTAVLHKATSEGFDVFTDGITIARSEYPERVLYEADYVRWIIGELQEKPDILAYDSEKHSGYVESIPEVVGQQTLDAATLKLLNTTTDKLKPIIHDTLEHGTGFTVIDTDGIHHVKREEVVKPFAEIDYWQGSKLYCTVLEHVENLDIGDKLYLQQSPAVAVPDDIAESLSYLDNTSYKKWKNNPNGFIAGDLEVSKLVKVVEFARAMLSTPTPSAEKINQPMVLVGRAQLNLALNALYRDAEEGRSIRKEIADELSASCVEQPDSAHKRITEQDALALLINFYEWSQLREWSADGDQYFNDEGRTLLAKLNEHREPDYKAQRDQYLNYLSAILNDKSLSLYEVREVARSAIAKASTSDAESGK